LADIVAVMHSFKPNMFYSSIGAVNG